MVLDWTNSFWSGAHHFGQVQIIKISPEKSNLNLTKMIWTSPKRIGPDQNNLDGPKSFWTYKGQGSNRLLLTFFKLVAQILSIVATYD